ncbi:DUF6911 family protein [Halioxenophilus aromaticivorans]|uniref:Uncharacterized protein n=1 Tax=Halioxenophilus aromaticivorans TaxID=1306992 RepID=A0AAV3TXU7_9ALTE
MFSFSWVIGCGDSAQGGSTDDVQVENVLEKVELILDGSGSVTLDVIDGGEIGPESLQVETEGGKSVISLGENTSDDYVIRTFTSRLAHDGKVSILGNEWDTKLVCEDSDLVKALVKEFLSTGNVSGDVLT